MATFTNSSAPTSLYTLTPRADSVYTADNISIAAKDNHFYRTQDKKAKDNVARTLRIAKSHEDKFKKNPKDETSKKAWAKSLRHNAVWEKFKSIIEQYLNPKKL